MTLDNNRIYINPDSIVSFSEFRFRENDIGLVGTSIVYCIGSTPTSISVRDPIDYVADQIMVGYDNRALLPLSKNKGFTPDGWRELEPKEIPSIGDKFWHDGKWHELHVDGTVAYECFSPTDIYIRKIDLLPQLQGKTIQISDLLNFENLEPGHYGALHKNFATLKSLYDPEASNKKFSECDHVIYSVNGQVYQVIRVLRDNCYEIHSNAFRSEEKIQVHADYLRKCEPYRKRTPPQETPPCNGNGEAQSKEG